MGERDMQHSVRDPRFRLISFGTVAGLALLVGCASNGNIPARPGVGDAQPELRTGEVGSSGTALDARLRRQGLTAVRDDNNRVQGYQVYFPGGPYSRSGQISD